MSTATPAKNLFRVVRGLHIEGRDENGKPIVYRKGDVVDSASDLTKFNSPNSTKFERVQEQEIDALQRDKNSPVHQAALEGAAELAPDIAGLRDTLGEMTIAELRKLAEDEEIELSSTMNKTEIITAIRGAMDLK